MLHDIHEIDQTETVFIVDDDPAARDSLNALVKGKGLATKTFESAEAFLDGFDREIPGCLITDVRMPGMSGLELQQYLQEQSVALPVIVVTGYGDVKMAVAAMSAGAVTILEKGFNEKDLLQSISIALDRGSQIRKKEEQLSDLADRVAKLSEGEVAVLRLLLAGRMNKQVSRDLDIGLRTVEMRRAGAMRTLGAETLAEAVRLSILGGIEPAGESEFHQP